MYRPKTTLEQCRILQAVVDYGSYAQAGQALNKSQFETAIHLSNSPDF